MTNRIFERWSATVGICLLACPISVSAQGTMIVPFGRNKELSPAHETYQFPYKENYIMLPLTNGTVTSNGETRVIVNKPVVINSRRTTVIPLDNGGPTVSPQPVVPIGMNGGNPSHPGTPAVGRVVERRYTQPIRTGQIPYATGTSYPSQPVQSAPPGMPYPSQPTLSTPHLEDTMQASSPTPASTPTPMPSIITQEPTSALPETETSDVVPEIPNTPSTPGVSDVQSSETSTPTPSNSGQESQAEAFEQANPYVVPDSVQPKQETEPKPEPVADLSQQPEPEPEPESAWRSGGMDMTAVPSQDYSTHWDESPMVPTRRAVVIPDEQTNIQSSKPQVNNLTPRNEVEKTPGASSPVFSRTPTPEKTRRIVEVRPRSERTSPYVTPSGKRISPAEQAPVLRESAPQNAPKKVPTQLPPPDPMHQPVGPINQGGGQKV